MASGGEARHFYVSIMGSVLWAIFRRTQDALGLVSRAKRQPGSVTCQRRAGLGQRRAFPKRHQHRWAGRAQPQPSRKQDHDSPVAGSVRTQPTPHPLFFHHVDPGPPSRCSRAIPLLTDQESFQWLLLTIVRFPRANWHILPSTRARAATLIDPNSTAQAGHHPPLV